ncbi:MAG: hypothetical protein WCI18_08335 [Pseudomonadota bacterium]
MSIKLYNFCVHFWNAGKSFSRKYQQPFLLSPFISGFTGHNCLNPFKGLDSRRLLKPRRGDLYHPLSDSLLVGTYHGRAESLSIVANPRNDIILEFDRMKTLLPTEKDSAPYGYQSPESLYASIQPEGGSSYVLQG